MSLAYPGRLRPFSVRLTPDTPDHDEQLLSDINRELRGGFASYAVLIQIGNELERELCADLLTYCARGDEKLSERAQYYISRLAHDPHVSVRIRTYAQSCLDAKTTR
jgi:hypothetical protein